MNDQDNGDLPVVDEGDENDSDNVLNEINEVLDDH